MLILSRSDVESLLEEDALMAAVADAMKALSSGEGSIPPRVAARVDARDALLAVMPAHAPGSKFLGAKLVSLFPQNRERPTHHAVIVCFDPDEGHPIALLDGEAITAQRTAAVSAVATDALARQDASTLAILGTGVQARSHAHYVPRVREFDRILVADRDRARAEFFAEELRQAGLTAETATGFSTAVAHADVVCATTHSPDPVVLRSAVQPGTHINSVGYNTAGREVDAEAVAAAYVVIESRPSTLADPPAGSNDLLWPVKDGLVPRSHVETELGEVLLGTAPARTSDDQITLYKSVGVAIQDAAAAALVLRRAHEEGIGTEFGL